MKDYFILIVYFLVYSFIGWAIESTYKSILQKKFVNSGFLAGPFCPIYGFGAMIMYLSLRNVTNNIIILFCFGMIVLSAFEYFVGAFLELVFKTKYWDYSTYKYNINGRVCLQNSLYWGILGIIFMELIHPLVELIVSKIPTTYIIAFMIIGITYMLIDAITTIVKLIKINTGLRDLEEVTERIREKIEAVNAKTKGKLANLREGENKVFVKHDNNKRIGALEDLKSRQLELRKKLEKRVKRLQKAFPSMSSERLSKFMNNSKKS